MDYFIMLVWETTTGTESKMMWVNDCDCIDSHMNEHYYGMGFSVLSEQPSV